MDPRADFMEGLGLNIPVSSQSPGFRFGLLSTAASPSQLAEVGDYMLSVSVQALKLSHAPHRILTVVSHFDVSPDIPF